MNKYFIVEVTKTENIQKKSNDESVKKTDIILILKKKLKEN